MISRNSSLDTIKELLKECLKQLEKDDIFERNLGKGVCERAIVFRFAHYLQNKCRDAGYFVDCDFNSSYEQTDSVGKLIPNQDETKPTKRFIDIIVHKRNADVNNLICIEIKKWNNKNAKASDKDRNNLYQLTTTRGYIYGFHIIIHKIKTESRWVIFRNDGKCTREMAVFGNEVEIWQEN